MSKTKRCIRDSILTILTLALAFIISILLQNVLDISEHVTTLFAFAVFIISLITDGFWYGIVSTIVSVAAINYAFTYPYLNMDFSVPESIFSALVMLIISFLTSMFTTRLKMWQMLKAEGEKERMRANLLRAVSHDLRTPLTTIYGASSSIIENYDKLSDAQKLQMSKGIKEDSEWLIRMVENLLSITRIDSGAVKLIKTPTVLEELIDSVIIKFKKRYPEQCVNIDIPDELVVIPMDAILIEQVIINLLENAAYHGHCRTIQLFATAENDTAFFTVQDDGDGISEELLPKLFTSTVSHSQTYSDNKRRNMGIGLSVCQTIIKAHGGRISAQNRPTGGAEFTFTLDLEE